MSPNYYTLNLFKSLSQIVPRHYNNTLSFDLRMIQEYVIPMKIFLLIPPHWFIGVTVSDVGQ